MATKISIKLKPEESNLFNEENSFSKPTSTRKQDSDEETKLRKSILGKRPVRRWEKRWILQPNVFELNEGDIWV
jgi:hypothetical protein